MRISWINWKLISTWVQSQGEWEWGEGSGQECVTTEQDSITLYKTFCLPKTNKKEQKLYHTFVPNMEWTDGMIRYQLSAGMACPSFYKKKKISHVHIKHLCVLSHTTTACPQQQMQVTRLKPVQHLALSPAHIQRMPQSFFFFLIWRHCPVAAAWTGPHEKKRKSPALSMPERDEPPSIGKVQGFYKISQYKTLQSSEAYSHILIGHTWLQQNLIVKALPGAVKKICII